MDTEIRDGDMLSMDYRNRIEVDIIDIFVGIFHSWIIIVLVGVVSMLVMGMYGYTTQTNEEIYNINTGIVNDSMDLYGVVEKRSKLDEDNAIYYEQLAIQDLRDISSGVARNYPFGCEVEEKEYYIALIADYSRRMHDGGYKTIDELIIALNTDDFSLANVIFTEYEEYNAQNMAVRITPSWKNTLVFGIVGFLAGMVIPIMVLAIRYAWSHAIKTTNDLRLTFELPILGEVDDKTGNADFLAANICAVAKENKCDNLVFSSSFKGAMETENVQSIADCVIKQGTGINCKGNLLSESATVSDVSESDAVVLFEKLKASKFEDVAREIEVCNNLGKKILGVVVLS